MPRPWLHLIAGSFAVAAALSGPGAARAQTPPKPAEAPSAAVPARDEAREAAMKALSGIVAGLGLKAVDSGERFINVQVEDATYTFALSDDDKLLYVETWWDVPKNKVQKVPLDKLLEWNGNHRTFFSLEKGQDGTETVYIAATLPMSVVTASSVRDVLDVVQADSGASDGMLDASKMD